MSAWYTTLEKVKASLEVNHTSRADRLIFPKIRAASLSVEGQTHRRFYPELRTFRYDYPNYQYTPSWQIWLGENELISSEGLIVRSGSVTLDNADILLRRSDGKDEPPYTFLQLDLDSDAAFGHGATWQQDISITGLTGYQDKSEVGGELAAGINASVTTVDINPVSGYMSVETGSLLKVGTERMITTNRRSIDTTIDLTANVTDHASVSSIPVTSGSAFAVNEVILINSERMQITDIANNNLIVERMFDGTVLGSHTSGDAVFALRRFTVERGVLGTTAAAHNSGDDVSVFLYPGLVEELATAEAIVMLEQATGAYAASRGANGDTRSQSGKGLPDIRDQCITAHGRVSRISAI